MPDPFDLSSAGLDLSSRFAVSTTVVASPTGATEVIIASVTVPDFTALATGIILKGWAAYTVGTSGVSARLRIRQTSVSGTVVVDTGAITETAANLDSQSVMGLDTAPAAGRVYKLTLTVASGAAASTVSAVFLSAIAV